MLFEPSYIRSLVMTGTIILSEKNLAPNGVFNAATTLAPYNRLTLNTLGMNLQGRKIGLKQLSIYYSWPNISTATSITIGWRIGGAYTNYIWTLPAYTNYKDMEILNDSLQTFCIANGLYLINAAGDYVYYLVLQSNENTYKIELNLFLVPTSLPATYSAPSNFAGYPGVSVTPRFTIPIGSEMSNLIGFLAGTYDGITSAISYSSTYVPQLAPVSCIYLTCNIATNDVPINSSTTIQAFTTQGTEYGSLIVVSPNQVTYYNIDCNSNNLEIELYDQNFNRLYVQDPQINCILEVI